MGKYTALQTYIDQYWTDLLVECREDTATHFGVPHPFIAPSVEMKFGFAFNEQFYWDSYFVFQDLVGTSRHSVCVGMIENMIYLFNKFGYIPNSTKHAHLGRSQPPLFTSMLRLVYESDNDLDLIVKGYETARDEYKNVWTHKHHPFRHEVFQGLSRFYHIERTNLDAEKESGWDFTTRFDNRALSFLPIDLNSFLYKYEVDLAFFANKLGRYHEAEEWEELAEIRKKKINRYMWHIEDGFYYDFDYKQHHLGTERSLAAYTPMFVGLADQKQAKRMVENLKWFETDLGLTTTPKDDPPVIEKQWASPNGWAPLHWLVVKGLLDYGFEDDARRIAQKWVDTVNHRFEKTGLLFEKYNMLELDRSPTHAVYPDQHGFAWTNSITNKFIKQFKLGYTEKELEKSNK